MDTLRSLCLLSLVVAQFGAVEHAVGQSPIQFSGTLRTASKGDTASVRVEHTFEASEGQRVEVTLSSDAFDTVLELISPNSEPLRNDDSGGGSNSSVSTIATASGRWRAVVSSFGGDGGAYDMVVTIGAAGTVRNLPAPALSASDSMSVKGLRYVGQEVRISSNGAISAQMVAEGFVPLLMLISPSGETFTGRGEFTGSLATVDIPFAEAGTWRVIAGQESSDEPVGAYTLRLIETPVPGDIVVTSGTLQEGDRRDLLGEYYDVHTVRADGMAPFVIELDSSEFDTYLAVRSPTGEWHRDDDGGENGSGSRLELPGLAGNWLVMVSSYAADETGRYQLRVVR